MTAGDVVIVSCGEALVDVVGSHGQRIAVPGGGPMNVAIAAARLDVPSAFIGRVSLDDDGEAIWDHLDTNRVDLRAAQRGPEPTARAIVEHRPELRFRFEGDNTADTCLSEVDLASLGGGPHILHGGTLGMFRGQTATLLADAVERHNGIVSLDPNVRPQIIDDRTRWDHFHQRWLQRSDIYKASDEDLEWIWPHRTVESIVGELLDGHASLVLITSGADGVLLATEDAVVSVDSVHVDVVDTVGAGDTFIAAILGSVWNMGMANDPGGLARLGREQLKVIGSRAAKAAALTCSRPGADPPTLAELED